MKSKSIFPQHTKYPTILSELRSYISTYGIEEKIDSPSHEEEITTATHQVSSIDMSGKEGHMLAQQAAHDEHEMTVLQALRLHKRAIVWSLLVSTAIIMEGYDLVLIYSFPAQKAFSRRYGEYIPSSDSYQISAPWQAGLTNAVSIGTIIGAFCNGYFTHKFGYRAVLLVSLSSMVGFIFLTFFAPNLPDRKSVV